jgi:predicted metal-dependent HD superfamily phosphohydrolase
MPFATRAGFIELWHSLSRESGEGIYELLERLYSDPSRAYHNLSHLESSFARLAAQNVNDDERKQIALAIWFHDAIYDTKAKDNEEKSAELFKNAALESGISKTLIAKVEEMILATKRHTAPAESSHALKLFMDIDLSILGAGAKEFADYDRAIRAEYSWVPGFVYFSKRRQVLKNFLKRPRLYYTQEMFTELEARSRVNLESATRRPAFVNYLLELKGKIFGKRP